MPIHSSLAMLAPCRAPGVLYLFFFALAAAGFALIGGSGLAPSILSTPSRGASMKKSTTATLQ